MFEAGYVANAECGAAKGIEAVWARPQKRTRPASKRAHKSG